jgi:hypothetical protein
MESREVLVSAPAAAAVTPSEQTQEFSLFALTMMVVGSMVGGASGHCLEPLALLPVCLARSSRG